MPRVPGPPTPAARLLADSVAHIRGERGWTQEDVAFAAGIPTATVSKIERCVLSPTLRTIEKLAKGLDVPIGEFFPID
ncbi:MAG: helix-turn-helix transcriptional regulator [Patulibacter sp.]|nr:helix-turn-helix transcriptional regulator [Patulibacter sp.]